MKTRLVSQSIFGLSVVVALACGCTRQSTGSSASFLNTASAQPALAESSPAPLLPGAMGGSNPAPAEVETPVAPVPAPNAETKLPPHLRVSEPLGAVIKLAQSGVDESVLLAFITNTTTPFTLGAEEIVYLNDLGVSGNAITAMMQHDQAMKKFWAELAQAQALSNQVTLLPEPAATAPTYVNPPVAETQPVEASDDYFNDTLSPYGTWIEVEGYGRCWQPTVVVVNSGWRPYCDRGRWVYSDCGWYWLSDYSWGAVAFHYGRWFSHARYGWCWWPDRVWAPSWVNWRYSGDYCGWAPLPPAACYSPGFGFTYYGGSVAVGFEFGLGYSAYNYVPWGQFCGSRPYHYRVPAHRAEEIHGRARPVNDFATRDRNVVMNKGISPDRVREYTRAEVRTVNIKDQAGRGTRTERLERDGRTLVVSRPHFKQPPGGTETAGRTATRTGTPRVEAASSTKISAPLDGVPSGRSERNEVKIDRSRAPGAREISPTSVPASPAPAVAPQVAVTPPPANPTRIEVQPTREREPRVEIRSGNDDRVRVSPAETAKSSTVPVSPTPVQRPTPILSKPFVVQSPPPQSTARPTAPSSSSSVVVVGGNNGSRSGGRDYSVWSSPSRPSEPASAPRYNAAPPAPQSPTVVSPVVSESRPAPAPAWTPPIARSQESGDRVMGGVRSESRSSTYAAPSAPAPVVRPAPQVVAPAPQPSFTPRPAPVMPSPSPAPSAPRVESRPAPAAPAVVQPSRSESRSAPSPSPSPSSGQSRPNR